MWSRWGLGASNMVSVVLRSENLLQWFLDSVHSQYTLPWCSIPCSISLVIHSLFHPNGAPFQAPSLLPQCHSCIFWASLIGPLSGMDPFLLGVASSLCTGLSQCNIMAVIVFTWLLFQFLGKFYEAVFVKPTFSLYIYISPLSLTKEILTASGSKTSVQMKCILFVTLDLALHCL